MILCLALSPSVDITYIVPGFTVGEVNRPESIVRVAGGKGLNVARAAQQLGASVTAIAPLGGVSGEWIAGAVPGLDLRVVHIDAPTRSCHIIVDPTDGSPVSTDLYEPPAALESTDLEAVAAAARAVDGSGWLALSGSVRVPLDQLADMVRDLRGRGWRLALDTHGEALAALLPLADLVKVNVAEASALLGASLEATEDAAALAAKLSTLTVPSTPVSGSPGRRVAVVTDGVRGASGVASDGTACSAAPARHGIYPVGSGDAFFAGLLTSLGDGATLAEALVVATSAAERNAFTPGPGILAPL